MRDIFYLKNIYNSYIKTIIKLKVYIHLFIFICKCKKRSKTGIVPLYIPCAIFTLNRVKDIKGLYQNGFILHLVRVNQDFHIKTNVYIL